MTSPVHIVADLAGLIALRDQIQTLRRELEDSVHVEVVTEPSLTGDADVSHAIERFVSGWRDGRQRIDEQLDRCHHLVDLAIETYQQADQALIDAVQSPESP